MDNLKSKVIGTRFKDPLLTKIQQHDMGNSQLIRTVMERYFMTNGKNNTLYNDYKTSDNKSDNNMLIQTMQLQIQDLKEDKDYLKKTNEVLMLSSIPLLSRMKMKLLKNR